MAILSDRGTGEHRQIDRYNQLVREVPHPIHEGANVLDREVEATRHYDLRADAR
jgi:hypothetical protein